MNKPNTELSACPFCGGTDLEVQFGTEDREGYPKCMVCTNCGACGPYAYESELKGAAKAMQNWNNQTITQATAELQANNAALRERVGFLISCVKSGEPLGSREQWVMDSLTSNPGHTLQALKKEGL